MNSPAATTPDSFGSQPAAALAPTHPFYWGIRRELWEYRSIYVAPLAAAGVAVLGFLFVLPHLSSSLHLTMSPHAMHPHDPLSQPFDLAGAVIMFAAFLVSIFYALDALYGERRDRSILFWKSLPVSDLTTVLAKATVLMILVPLVAFAITVVTSLIMFLLSTLVLVAHGESVANFWTQLHGPRSLFLLLYHLVTVHMLWYAPLYAWMLLVSAWARRAPLLWLALPILLITAFEKLAFHTSYFIGFLQERVAGSNETMDSLSPDFPWQAGVQTTFLRFLSMPGLWYGLLAAAVFLYAAARVRRYRMPN